MPPQTPPTRTPASSRGQNPAWLFISLGVLLVLALIIGGAWWLGRAEDNAGGRQAGATTPTAEVALEDRLPVLPGEQNPANSTMSVDRGVELNLYSAGDAAFLKASGAEDIVYRSAIAGAAQTDTYVIVIVRATSLAQAAKIAEHMRESLTKAGGVPDSAATTVGSDVPLMVTNATGRLAATWYVSGTNAVGVGTAQAPSGEVQELRQRLQRTLDAVAEVLPRG
jgi:hypothetical protein